MEKDNIKARHYFDNCKASFRLLQGALLSGNYAISIEEREKLWNRFFEIEKNQKGNKKDVIDFFMKLKEPETNEEILKRLSRKLKFEDKQIIVIDDQYHSAGWKETFEFIFGVNSVKGFNTIKDFNNYIKSTTGSKKRNIFSIFIDINFSSENESGRQGIEFIEELSERYPVIPLIAFSAYDSSVWVKRAFTHSAWDYFSKDPDEKESTDYRNAEVYYQNFIRIIDRFYAYHEIFSGTYSRLNEFQLSLGEYSKNKEFKQHAKESILTAYRYLILDFVIRFSPNFLKASKEDEIVFQMTKAFESFLVCVLDSYKLIPAYKNVDSFGNANYGAGDLVDKLKAIDLLKGETEDWFKKLYYIVGVRNQKMHRYKVAVIRREFITNPDVVDYEKAKQIFTEVLDTMIEILNRLKPIPKAVS